MDAMQTTLDAAHSDSMPTPARGNEQRVVDLVLLHGWGMDLGVWDALLATLGASVRPHPLRLPGHGGTPFDPNRRSLADWAADALAQAPPRAVWVGWSLGGLVALQAALGADGPARIAALVLIGSTPRFTEAPDWPTAMPAATFAAFQRALVSNPTATLERFQMLLVRGGNDPRDQLRRLRQALGPVTHDPAALAVGLDLLAGTDLRAALPALQVPVDWLFGDGDALVPVAAAAAVSTLLPAARVHTLTRAAHGPMLSHTNQLAALVRAALIGRTIASSEGRVSRNTR